MTFMNNNDEITIRCALILLVARQHAEYFNIANVCTFAFCTTKRLTIKPFCDCYARDCLCVCVIYVHAFYDVAE